MKQKRSCMNCLYCATSNIKSRYNNFHYCEATDTIPHYLFVALDCPKYKQGKSESFKQCDIYSHQESIKKHENAIKELSI